MAGPVVQNVSIPAGDAADLNFDVDPDDGQTLLGADIYWKVYEQEHGVPKLGVDPVIVKVLDDGIQITDPDALKFTVAIQREDTVGLLRNYHHEAKIIDPDGNHVTVNYGVFTVTQTENRE